jgi:signal transduction histidine kinase
MKPAGRRSTHAAEALDKQLLALNAAVLAISSDLSLAETLRHIVVAAAELVDAEYGALGVPDEVGELLVEFITTGLSAEAEARISHRPRGHGLLGVILHEHQSLRLRDLRDHPRSAGFPEHHPLMSSFLGVPILYKGKALGNLYLTNKRGADEFSEQDQRLIEQLAANAAVAIANARLHEKVQQLRVVEERQRIGMDLHDGIIQSIYAVGLNLEYVNGLLADGNAQGASERVQAAIEALNATIRDIRSYILDLRPRHFNGEDLVTGLQQLLSEFRANTLMGAEFRADSQADRALTPEGRRVLFHIAQEALSNAARHSRASLVEVRLTASERNVELVLKDNGRGFDMASAERRVGHGLLNMRERAQGLGGTWTIESHPGEGTEVRVSLPKRAPAQEEQAPPRDGRTPVSAP